MFTRHKVNSLLSLTNLYQFPNYKNGDHIALNGERGQLCKLKFRLNFLECPSPPVNLFLSLEREEWEGRSARPLQLVHISPVMQHQDHSVPLFLPPVHRTATKLILSTSEQSHPSRPPLIGEETSQLCATLFSSISAQWIFKYLILFPTSFHQY